MSERPAIILRVSGGANEQTMFRSETTASDCFVNRRLLVFPEPSQAQEWFSDRASSQLNSLVRHEANQSTLLAAMAREFYRAMAKAFAFTAASISVRAKCGE